MVDVTETRNGWNSEEGCLDVGRRADQVGSRCRGVQGRRYHTLRRAGGAATALTLCYCAGGLAPGGGNPEQLAHGISVALYNTAFGLIVAIPALIFWRYFRARVDDYLLSMELAAERFARHLMTLRR